MPTAVVVSTWNGAPPEHLILLCRSIDRHPAGMDFTLYLSANGLDYQVPSPLDGRFERVFRRPNRGYNLGAWNHAWRQLRNHDRFLFLQDDCLIRRDHWLAAFTRCFDATTCCGLVGEHLNRWWNRPWTELERLDAGDLMVDGAAVARARYYRDALVRWSVPPGETARHLTAVVQFTSRAILDEVGGYEEGRSYDEAVAAEIAFSRKIEAHGYRLVQLGRTRHSWVAHRDWPDEGTLGRLRHRVRMWRSS
jgi:hypothetical protein